MRAILSGSSYFDFTTEKEIMDMKKRKIYNDDFKKKAIMAMAGAINVSVLAKELGVDPSQLYQWRKAASGGRKKKTLRTVMTPVKRQRGLEAITYLQHCRAAIAKRALAPDDPIALYAMLALSVLEGAS
jgi:transposase-like protein